jgi:quinol-cytochrome oxidoreductase complex cytochrome b subunit
MVVAVMLHMLRVFLTGSYKSPREFNWVIGVVLLVLVLLLSLTGYLLPWDQLSFWAVTVASNMAGAAPLVGAAGPGHHLLSPALAGSLDPKALLLGGPGVGENTLNRFYVLHCVAIPLLAGLLMAFHFWRVRKDGISGPL